MATALKRPGKVFNLELLIPTVVKQAQKIFRKSVIGPKTQLFDVSSARFGSTLPRKIILLVLGVVGILCIE
jgi:hypothetical protein